MFFTKTARILAIVAFVLGLLGLLLGISAVTFGHWGPDEVTRYGSPWRNIDRGIYTILFAIALGTLAEISISLRKRLNDSERAAGAHKNIQHTVSYTELAPDRFKDFWC